MRIPLPRLGAAGKGEGVRVVGAEIAENPPITQPGR